MAILDSDNPDRPIGKATSVVRAIQRSLSLKLVLVGVGFVSLGFSLQTGVYAALLPIWGVGLLLVGAVSYVLIWRTRR